MAETVRIDETAQKAVADYAESHGIPLSRAATQLIMFASDTAADHAATLAPPLLSLDAAAAVLLRHLPPSLVEKLQELCKEYQVSPAAYLLSYAKLADERGELSIHLHPDDRVLGTALAPAPVPTTGVCAYCGNTFTPSREAQKYCPEPEDWSQMSCGRKALLDELHKRRPPEAQRKNIAARASEKTLR